MIATSSTYASDAKCTVLADGVPYEERNVEILPADMNGQLTVFGNFSLKIESDTNGVRSMVLIDSKRGALASATIINKCVG